MFILSSGLPAFPKIDLTTYINWFRDGFVAVVVQNAPVVIGSAIVIGGLLAAVSKIKGFGKKSVKG